MKSIIQGKIKDCKRIMKVVQIGMHEDEVAFMFYNEKTGKPECSVILKKGIEPNYQNHLFYICQFRKKSKINSALKKWN